MNFYDESLLPIFFALLCASDQEFDGRRYSWELTVDF